MNLQRMEIVNAELGIGACTGDDIPKSIKQQMPMSQITVFYWHKRDWMVLNKDNPNYQYYKSFIEDYLKMEDVDKKLLNDFAMQHGVSFFGFINKVLRIRKKRYRAKKNA